MIRSTCFSSQSVFVKSCSWIVGCNLWWSLFGIEERFKKLRKNTLTLLDQNHIHSGCFLCHIQNDLNSDLLLFSQISLIYVVKQHPHIYQYIPTAKTISIIHVNMKHCSQKWVRTDMYGIYSFLFVDGPRWGVWNGSHVLLDDAWYPCSLCVLCQDRFDCGSPSPLDPSSQEVRNQYTNGLPRLNGFIIGQHSIKLQL